MDNILDKWIKLSAGTTDFAPGVAVSFKGSNTNTKYTISNIDPTTGAITLEDSNGKIVKTNKPITADMLVNMNSFHDFQNGDYIQYNNMFWVYDAATKDIIMLDRNTLKPVNDSNHKIKINPAVIKGSRKLNADEVNKIKAINFTKNLLNDKSVIDYQGILLEYRATNPPVLYRLDSDLNYFGSPISADDISLNMVKVLNRQQIDTLKFKSKNKPTVNHKIGDRVIITDNTNKSVVGKINDIDSAGNIILETNNGKLSNFEAANIKQIRNYGSNPQTAEAGKVYAQLDTKLKPRLEKIIAGVADQMKNGNTLTIIKSIIDTLTSSVCEVDGFSNIYTTMNFGELGVYNIPNRYVIAARNINGRWVPTIDMATYVRNNRVKLPGLSAPQYQGNQVAYIIQFLLSKTNKMMW